MRIVFPKHKEFYIKTFLAYTEDDVLVTNILLNNISAEISSKMLLEYLESFGKVTKFHLKYDPAKRDFYYNEGFVIFDRPLSAANILLTCKFHHINKYSFAVRPNYSWNQPNQCAPSSRKRHTRRRSAIESLNDDCLEHIIRLLSLPDRIHFARTCLRFCSIYKQVSSVLDKSVDLEIFNYMTEWDVRDFFMLSGSFVRELKGAVPYRHRWRFNLMIFVNCTNLKTLNISHTPIIIDINKMLDLQYLLLVCCEIKDDFLPMLKKLEHLKSLDLSSNEELSGINMDQLPASLESLTLNNCRNLKHISLPKACKALPKLKELHIRDTSKLKQSIKQLFSEKCYEYLEVVSLSTLEDEYVHVAELPSLKKLTIQCNSKIGVQEDLWSLLVKHKSTQLEYLEVLGENNINANVLLKIGQLSALRTLKLPNNIEINYNSMMHLYALQELKEIDLRYCTNVSHSSILRLIMTSPKLQVLNLQSCKLSNRLITDILSQLCRQIQQMVTQRPMPIKLFVYGTEINKNSLTNPKVAAKNIIDVSLEAPPITSRPSKYYWGNCLTACRVDLDNRY